MRDFVHVDDVAAANVVAAQADRGGFIAANVCSGQPISILEVAAQLCDARGIPWCPRSSPANTAAATCATSSPIRPVPPRCSVSGRW